MSALNWPWKTTPKWPLKCWNPSSGSKVTFLVSLDAIQPQKGEKNWSFGLLEIDWDLKNYPKMTPQMLKSVQWFKSYIFGLFRGHTASKKWKIKFRRTLYGQGDGAWQFSGISGQGELMSRNSDFAPIVFCWNILIKALLVSLLCMSSLSVTFPFEIVRFKMLWLTQNRREFILRPTDQHKRESCPLWVF